MSDLQARLQEALKHLVDELNWYAGKHGLGPVRVMAALAQAKQLLADLPASARLRACEWCHEPDADGGGVWVDVPGEDREEWLCGGCVSKIAFEQYQLKLSLRQPSALPSSEQPALPANVLEFLTDLSNATEYKSHDLGFADSISRGWKEDAADLLTALNCLPASQPAAKEPESKP